MKKGVDIGIVSGILALFLIMIAWSVLAAPTRAKASTITYTDAGRAQQMSSKSRSVVLVRRRHRHVRFFPFGPPQQNNQSFFGNSDSGTKTSFSGHDQGNSGNTGYNIGHAQDNALNSGNQLLNQFGSRAYRQNNQLFVGNGNSFDHSYFVGYNQGNTGNAGYNRGSVQDNSVNAGNQITN
jgi:hypothetical protein